MASIYDSLASAATKYAHRAVASYVGGDVQDFCLSAGIALEQAMKARLARDNVAFIAPDRSFKSALALWRTKEDVAQLPIGTKTIGGWEALERVRATEPTFERHVGSVRELLAFRNGEAHIGAPGSSDQRKVFSDFASALTSLLKIPAKEFWAEHMALIRVAIDETAAELSKVVAEKLAEAALRFKRKYDHLSAPQREALQLIDRQEAERQRSDQALLRDCPACTAKAILSGSNFVEFDLDVDDRDAIVVDAHPYIEFRAHGLNCPSCGLELNWPDEIEEAGIEVVFVNEEADLAEYMREYYGLDDD